MSNRSHGVHTMKHERYLIDQMFPSWHTQAQEFGLCRIQHEAILCHPWFDAMIHSIAWIWSWSAMRGPLDEEISTFWFWIMCREEGRRSVKFHQLCHCHNAITVPIIPLFMPHIIYCAYFACKVDELIDINFTFLYFVLCDPQVLEHHCIVMSYHEIFISFIQNCLRSYVFFKLQIWFFRFCFGQNYKFLIHLWIFSPFHRPEWSTTVSDEKNWIFLPFVYILFACTFCCKFRLTRECL